MRLPSKIGAIEIAGDEVQVAVVKTGGRLPNVLELHVARASYAVPEGREKALAEAAREAIGQMRLRPASFVLCASSQWAVVRMLSIPFRGSRRVAAAVRFELEPYLAFPIEELVVDFTTIGEADGNTLVLAVGMRRAQLEEQIRVLSAAGVDPDGIDLDVTALTALWQAGYRYAPGLHALLQVHGDSLILAIVNDKTLVFFRHLSIDSSAIHGDPGAVAREVQNSLRAFLATWKRDGEINALSVVGVDVTEEEQELFQEGLAIPVTYKDLRLHMKGMGLDQLDREEVVGGTDGQPAEPLSHTSARAWYAVVGAAMAAAGGTHSFDFRQGELARPDVWRGLITHAAFSSALTGLALSCLVLYCYLDYRHNLAEVERIGNDIWTTFVELFPNTEAAKKRPAQDMGGFLTHQALAQEIKKLGDTAEAVPVDVFRKPTFLDIMAEIHERLPGDLVTITELRMWGGRNPRITISGEIKDPNAFPMAFANLRQSTKLQVDEEPTRSTKEGKATFVITARR
jgi:hypothetical protein